MLPIPMGPDIYTSLTGESFFGAPARAEQGTNVWVHGGEAVHSVETPSSSRLYIRHNSPSPINTIKKSEEMVYDNRSANSTDVSILPSLHRDHFVTFPSASKTRPSTEENEQTIYSKTRFERRLRDRWRCKVKGHSCCFRNGESAHIPLTEDHLKQWANICVGTDHFRYKILVSNYPLAQWLCNYPCSTREHHTITITPQRLGHGIRSLQRPS